MRSIMTRALASALLIVPLAACSDDDPIEVTEQTIVEVAQSAGFNTLLTAVEAAGLTATLESDGPFTVFAPTDAAFAALPAGTLEALLADTEQLAAILTYHVVAGEVTSDVVVTLDEAVTVNGATVAISVEGGQVRVNDANVVQVDVGASNGVIHVIDKVILPPM